MRSKLVAGGIALALNLSACGESSPNPERLNTPLETQLTDQQLEVKKILDYDGKQPLGIEFTGFELSRLKTIGQAGVTADNKEISRVEATTTDEADPNLKQKVELYTTIQTKMAELALRFPKLEIPVFDRKNGKRSSKEIASLQVPKYASVLILARQGDFRTKAGEGTPTTPVGITFRPTELHQLDKSVSFVVPNGSELASAAAIGIEACQARLDIRAQERFRIPLQEAVCNSLGMAYVTALGGFSYKRYEGIEDQNTNIIATQDAKTLIPKFVLSRKAYMEIQAGKTPSSLAGGRVASHAGAFKSG